MKCIMTSLLVVAILTTVTSTGRADVKTYGDLKSFSVSSTKGGKQDVTRGARVEEKIRNDNPAFVVRVDVDHPNRVYRDGELMKVNVVSEKSGYLYLFYKQADDKIVCLFPNKIQKDNQIVAHRKTFVPMESADFNLRIGAPFGVETLIAVVSLKPIAAGKFGTKSLTDSNATRIDEEILLKAIDVELKPKPADWAEHHISITTSGKTHQPTKQKRFGLFIGVNDYKDERVPDLPACERDAKVLAKLMVDDCQINGAVVLTDSDAKLKTIRKAFEALVAATKPGDEVFIFWSGHGARCADDNGDERDGDRLDEFLIPHDFKTGGLAEIRGSVLMDDTFGHWIQELDGRQVTVMIDACHAGGQSIHGKGFADSSDDFDFFLNECARTKDIGQKDAAMLLSSQAEEISKVRKDGNLSVMTYYLIESINKSNKVTLTDAFRHLKPRVLKYVEQEFPNSAQTPVLSNDVGTVFLKR